MNIESLAPQVLEHAAREAPRECCGLAVVVKGRLRYWPCRNISTANAQFEIDPEDYARAEEAGAIVGVCHSHVFLPPTPSQADRVSCEATGLPWLIVSHPTGQHLVLKPEGYVAPLEGRQYTHGVLDCYQLIVDYYKQTLGIEMPHFHREDGWWLQGGNLYLENYEKADFVQVGDGTHLDLREHDVLLLQVGSPVPNHAAVVLADGCILHHVYGRLSSRDIYGGYWRNATTHVLRHRSLL